MATVSSIKKAKEKLMKENVISEAYFTALFWNNPENYNFYPKERVNTSTFLNGVWGFFFGLGRYMFDKDVKTFDDITVAKYIKELGLQKKFDDYGGCETVYEVMREVGDYEENIDSYYSEIKKYQLLSQLINLFGDKIVVVNDKYNYKHMTKDELFLYWNDKVNQLGMDGDNRFDEHNLLEGLQESVKRWDENPDIGLPFYNSPLMTRVSTGWDYGNLYLFGGFGGSGKTSMSFNKIIMSCIENKEKLLIIANEQSIDEFKKMLLITAMGVGTKKPIVRQRLNEGSFTEDEKKRLDEAIAWVDELCGGEYGLIKFVFMEDYIITDVKKIVKHYSNRGYKSVMIDTGKPSDEKNGNEARHAQFADDFKELYKITRKNGGGLNLRMWVNVQLTDTALTRRFLNEHAFGESKKIKNEASVVYMIRGVWDDEYEGGANELECYKHIVSKGREKKVEFKLERGEKYYLMFTPKNRRGQDNKTGLDVLILKPNFNNNTWQEVGFCKVYDDKNY